MVSLEYLVTLGIKKAVQDGLIKNYSFDWHPKENVFTAMIEFPESLVKASEKQRDPVFYILQRIIAVLGEVGGE